ncbi:MAG TPA: hypothetical protein VFE88_00820 [Candidatus Nanoarchaeia archaeon]|nr:hypothetical protein [Candidatus Nanoarchaeia archaeon]
MALFGLGKKEERKPASLDFQRLPNLPEFPSAEEEVPELPHYEPTIHELKREVTKAEPAQEDIPFREKRVTPVFSHTKPASVVHSEEKPLFIQLEHYKEALRAVDTLKAKIIEAERVLKAIEDIRDEENSKLESWKTELQTIKEKLLSIDQHLFEA